MTILASFVLALLAASSLHAQQSRPNILFVLTDDHSARFLGVHDPHLRTPNLDRFAAEGMRFDRAYVSAPQCVPSRASLMTGRSPVDVDMTRFGAPLKEEVPAVPELLSRHSGYYTGTVGRSYHLDSSGRLAPEVAELFEKHRLLTFRNRLDFVEGGPDAEVPALVAKFLDRVPAGRPFFLWANFSDPHRVLDENAIPEPHDPRQVTLPPYFPDTRLIREDLARYYDEVSRVDGRFGEILEILERRGLAENTLVVFMGDNGGALLRGKGALYEMGVRVPLLARWPGVTRPGTVSAALVSGEDIAATFWEVGGAPIPDKVTGKSLVPVLSGSADRHHDYVFSARGPHGYGLPSARSTAPFDLGRTVVGPRYKLIYNALLNVPYAPIDFAGDETWREIVTMNEQGALSPDLARIYFELPRPLFELYDLQEDPHEMTNLAGRPELAEVEERLKYALTEQMILNWDYLPLPIKR